MMSIDLLEQGHNICDLTNYYSTYDFNFILTTCATYICHTVIKKVLPYFYLRRT